MGRPVALASGVGKCRWNGCGRDSTLGFHPGEPICSECVEAAPGATPGDAASGRQEEAAKDDLTDADFIPDDYFITDDDVVDDEEPARQDDKEDE